MAKGNHQGAIEDCCLALWAREPGDTQWDRKLLECLLSQVFEDGGDVETGEKKVPRAEAGAGDSVSG